MPPNKLSDNELDSTIPKFASALEEKKKEFEHNKGAIQDTIDRLRDMRSKTTGGYFGGPVEVGEKRYADIGDAINGLEDQIKKMEQEIAEAEAYQKALVEEWIRRRVERASQAAAQFWHALVVEGTKQLREREK